MTADEFRKLCNMDRQKAALQWVKSTFGEDAADPMERARRFIEEAVELVQCMGLSASEINSVVAYVYGRPVGELGREIGGVMITLEALAEVCGHNAAADGFAEFVRVLSKSRDHFRNRQNVKADCGIARRSS